MTKYLDMVTQSCKEQVRTLLRKGVKHFQNIGIADFSSKLSEILYPVQTTWEYSFDITNYSQISVIKRNDFVMLISCYDLSKVVQHTSSSSSSVLSFRGLRV